MDNKIIARICLFSFFILSSVVSCTKIERYDEDSSEAFMNYIRSASNNKISIEETAFSSNSLTVSFSDNNKKKFSFDLFSVYSIGIDGYWYANGGKTDILLSESNGENLVIPEVMSSNRIGGIVEDYTGWTFVFNDGSSVSLLKTIYSIDADAIMRSVNHRGYSYSAPENTLPAFRLSRLNGFRYVETDVRFTMDGVPVLLHDLTVDRTSNGDGRIDQLTFKEVRSLDFGRWQSSKFENTVIPSFEEFLALCSEIGLEPNIELKCGTQEQIHDIVKLVDKYGLKGKSTYISFSWQLLHYALEEDNSARVGFLSSRINESIVSSALDLRTGFNEVYIGSADYSESSVQLCKKAGLPLSVYVIDSKEQLLALPAYVSSVTSNRIHAGWVLYEARTK